MQVWRNILCVANTAMAICLLAGCAGDIASGEGGDSSGEAQKGANSLRREVNAPGAAVGGETAFAKANSLSGGVSRKTRGVETRSPGAERSGGAPGGGIASPRGRWELVCATAYSPHDPIDDRYRATKGKWLHIAADGITDVREEPYGIAVPLNARNRPYLPFGTRLLVPAESGYLPHVSNRVFTVDDVGNGRRYFSKRNGCLHIDLRFKDHASAIRWAGPRGYRFIRVFIYAQ